MNRTKVQHRLEMDRSLWSRVMSYKVNHALRNADQAVEILVRKGLEGVNGK